MSSGRRAGLPCMTRIIADISISLDGFVTGPDPGPENGLGTGGEALHTWAFSDDPDDQRLVREGTARSGAVESLPATRATTSALLPSLVRSASAWFAGSVQKDDTWLTWSACSRMARA